ncbi:thymidylate kinase [Variovorax paradoxus]|uniref:Thymidylate kinase n=1 Tax=Variovorax paradoxus TaxID=34073 RepID=A0A0D0LQP0_VARPD|nr:dTMP kinase [Variovorax paradoxus]KIQ31528.1 thymidylate kinase [Variovorax paradoxus]
MSKGLFLTLEGIDGAGKSSHLDAMEALFNAQGRTVVRTREPGGTPLAETLRGLILEQPMDPLTESLLVFAARRDHIVQVIEPALARGDLVLCDRFTDATFAYQGAGRGFDAGVLSTLEQWAQGGRAEGLLQPDVTLWFDLAPEIAAQRLAGARLPDKFEAQPVEFFRRVAQGYADRAAADAQRFVRIDASQARDQVWQQIEAALVARGVLASHSAGVAR